MKLLLNLVYIFRLRSLKYPKPNFEENPRYFNAIDVAYFSFKYYHTQITCGDKYSNTEQYFAKQEFETTCGPSQLRISLGGDLMPYANINKDTCPDLWEEVGEFFFSSDIVFANLETPIDLAKPPGAVPEVMLKGMLFNGTEELFKIFNGNGAFRGFDVLSTANNHALDQGVDGLTSTLEFLQKQKVAFSGCALTEKEVHSFPILERNGISVAFLSYTFSLNEFDLPNGEEWRCNHIRLNSVNADIGLVVQQTKIARDRGADIVIVSLHMGNAYQAYPSQHVHDTIHRICIEGGVDVVAGSHPHNPQPAEWYKYIDHDGNSKKSLIFYSLGDFVAYDIYSWAHLALLVKLDIQKIGSIAEVTGFKILPAYLLAEFAGINIQRLIFRHIERVHSDRYHARRHIQKDIESVYALYKNSLFTTKQREQIMVEFDRGLVGTYIS